MQKKRTPTRKASDAVRGRVRAHDPFELIRWLAMSQPDPRKALAELVQNSLDAGARRIRVVRIREKGSLCLRIWDDGAGVIPEMNRPEALRYIATHIGHSRKRSLSPQERMALMTQGQYGIGLLGFWSLGETLDMRTSVAGQRPHRLVLQRDLPDFLIEPLRGRLGLDETWTEVVVWGLHREATSALIGRRASDYLASELRGQLLMRDVDLQVEDRISRGRAAKQIVVRPMRFLGARIEGLSSVPVEGRVPIRMEIYLAGDAAGEGGTQGIGIYAAGTLVAEGFRDLGAIGLDHAPWTDLRLTGMIDFPELHVAPGSRRGIIADEAAGAFARALLSIESILADRLARVEQERAQQFDRSMIRDLQRAFRDFYRHRPRYAMLPVNEPADQGAGPLNENARGQETCATPEVESTLAPPDPVAPAPDGESPPSSTVQPPDAPAGSPDEVLETIPLFPPGPLASVRISPGSVRIMCDGHRRVRAEGLDRSGRPVEEAVEFTWEIHGMIGSLDSEHGMEVVLTAGSDPCEGRLIVVARSGGLTAVAEALVEVIDPLTASRSKEGIPEPEFVNHPGSAWRSRMEGERWQVNAGHRDYLAIADRPALKLRYLATLFSKEIVLRSHHDPRLERPLEQMAEIIAYADQRLSVRGRGLNRREPAAAQPSDPPSGS